MSFAHDCTPDAHGCMLHGVVVRRAHAAHAGCVRTNGRMSNAHDCTSVAYRTRMATCRTRMMAR